jgi:hypothetical protein
VIDLDYRYVERKRPMMRLRVPENPELEVES